MKTQDLQHNLVIGAKHRRKIAGKKAEIALDGVAICCNNRAMSKIRDAILSRMAELNLTTYRVSKMVEGEVPQRTVYSFLSGEVDASSEVVSILMNALGLTITVKSKKMEKRLTRTGKFGEQSIKGSLI